MRNIANDILFEDNHLIVINKKAKDIVQGDKTGDETLGDFVKAYLVKKYNKPGDAFLGVIHRLDRPVSGAVIFAKTSKSLTRMNELIRNGELKKTYWAVVENRPEMETGHLKNWLRKNEKQNKSFISKENSKDSKLAELKYKLVLSGKNYHLLEIELLTGRHHQIRAQLSNLNCPIKGDLKYGAARSNKDGSISLHSRIIQFTHPITKKEIKITAPTPKDDVWNIFR